MCTKMQDGKLVYQKKRTVMLAAMADGTKLLPMVILKGVQQPHDVDITAGIVVVMAPKSW